MKSMQTKQLGLTLIELVVSIVVLSVTAVSIMMLVSRIAVSSADPMVKTQAIALIQAYHEKLLALPLDDPGSGGSNDNVTDFAGQSDTVNGYQVSIQVVDLAPLAPTHAEKSGLPTELHQAHKISVSVNHTALGAAMTARTYRWR